jgi:hypothetical protein
MTFIPAISWEEQMTLIPAISWEEQFTFIPAISWEEQMTFIPAIKIVKKNALVFKKTTFLWLYMNMSYFNSLQRME